MTTSDATLTLPRPTAERPLLGLTVLLVEDSRFAAEGLRLMCRHSGARLRRADSLHTARRHLACYRPTVAIVDLGLPDGPGTELIAELAAVLRRPFALLAISADPDGEEVARAAGADGFLAKPLTALATFQTAILAHLPADRQPPSPRSLPLEEELHPDPIALRDDLTRAAEVLRGAEPGALPWVSHFLTGLARTAGDRQLDAAAQALAEAPTAPASLGRVTRLVEARLAAAGPI